MEIQIGVAKINKYASSESGDTLEIVERPNGGLSVVLADGQRSGKSAKRISNMVVRKVIALLAEGVRDGPAARAASDYLYSQRAGKVQSTLNIISIDLESKTLVLTRNNPVPILIRQGKEMKFLNEESTPVGIYRNTRPVISEYKIETDLTIVAFTDGLVHAGDRKGEKFDLEEGFKQYIKTSSSAQEIADGIMKSAMDLDQNRPIDDISVVVIQVIKNEGDDIRRMLVRLPIK
ncbi:MAG: serine/threonine-protein phosphatase [Chloroflexota bacterium]